MEGSTIAAISSGLTESGVSVIRISGRDSFKIISEIFYKKNGERVFSSVNEMESHTVHHGFIVDGGVIIDEVLVILMRAPKTFTGEDTVEIDCHGGILVTRRVLEACINAGAVLATPGEFSKRAFLNGKMDLTKAESIMDLISSENDLAMSNSLSMLKGGLKDKVSILRKEMIHETARIESALDDPEHYDLTGYSDELYKEVTTWKDTIKELIDSADYGANIKDGIKTLILGRPNVGKSSLFNLLVNDERAIVTDIPGTTRDIVEEKISLGEFSLRVMDTAGIRDTSDVVEKIGVDRALSLIDKAGLIIYVIDGSVTLNDDDFKIMSEIIDKTAIILINKSDIGEVVSIDDVKIHLSFIGNEKGIDGLSGKALLPFSNKDAESLKPLKEEIKKIFFNGDVVSKDKLYITSERQKAELINSYNSLMRVSDSIDNAMPEDFYTVDLMDAYGALSRIVGQSVDEDLVNEIFSKFCMGK